MDSHVNNGLLGDNDVSVACSLIVTNVPLWHRMLTMGKGIYIYIYIYIYIGVYRISAI